MIAKRLSALLVAGLPLVYAACGGENLTLPPDGAPATIVVFAGNGLSGTVGTQLGQPLVVKVTDTRDRPVEGVPVNFAFDDVSLGGGVSPSTANTNAEGLASSVITLGTRVGAQNGHAWVTVDEGSAPVETPFTVNGLSDNANRIAAVGENQNGPVGTALPQPLVVQVTDAFGNPIPGIPVDWSVTGGGSVTPTSTQTGADGLASVQRTLGGTAGTQTTVATSPGLAGSPVTFTHIATAGNAAGVEIVSGNGQSAPAGTRLDGDLVVRVRDDQGNPVSGRPVSWVVGAGGGTPDPATSNTNGDGIARTKWTLGTTPGQNTLNAVVSGVGTATFTATGTGAGSPSILALTTQPPSSVTVGQMLNPGPVVQVRDAAGNDVGVAGVAVTVALASGPGRLEGTRTRMTDGNGRAQFADLRITEETGTHRLIFAADGYRSVTSNQVAVNKASTTTTITGDSPDPSNPNEPVTVTFTVTSGSGTPTGRVEVRASGGNASCEATLSQGSGSCVLDDLSNPGQRTITAEYQGDDLFASSSDEESHTVNEPPPPQNQPPTAFADFYTAQQGTTLEVGGANGLLNNDVDPEGDDMFVHSHTEPTSGTLQLNDNGTFSYTPAPGATTAMFTYIVRDENGAVGNTADVTITINP